MMKLKCKMCGNELEHFRAIGHYITYVSDYLYGDGRFADWEAEPGDVIYESIRCNECDAEDEGTDEFIEGAKEWLKEHSTG